MKESNITFCQIKKISDFQMITHISQPLIVDTGLKEIFKPTLQIVVY